MYLLLALLAQIEVLHFFRFRDVEISLVLVAVVWYSVRVDIRRAAAYGLIAGILEDVLATQTGAAWTISTTATAILAGMLSRGFFADSIPLLAVIVAVATLIRDLLFWIVMALEGYPAGHATQHLHQTLWQALLNAVFASVVLSIVRYNENRRVR